MTYNLFVAYDLMRPGQNYEAVERAIQSLGKWYKFQYSLFYVHTPYSPQDAHRILRLSMDSNDRLVVIEATGAMVSHYPIPDINAVNMVWFSDHAAAANLLA